MSDAGFAAQTLEKFHQRALGDVELLRDGIAAGDIEKTTRLAHNLKSAAAHAAASPLRKIAFEIEQAGGRRDLQFIEKQLARLEAEAAAVRPVLSPSPRSRRLNRTAQWPPTPLKSS